MEIVEGLAPRMLNVHVLTESFDFRACYCAIFWGEEGGVGGLGGWGAGRVSLLRF